MKLDQNFNREIEGAINSCQPLADWFERNQQLMAYLGLTHKGCLHFENSYANGDVVVLGRMANAGLTWLEAPKALNIPEETKAYNAAMAIAMVYEEDKTRLSENARTQYYLDVEALGIENTVGRSI